jgi:hypothetical protein
LFVFAAALKIIIEAMINFYVCSFLTTMIALKKNFEQDLMEIMTLHKIIFYAKKK